MVKTIAMIVPMNKTANQQIYHHQRAQQTNSHANHQNNAFPRRGFVITITIVAMVVTKKRAPTKNANRGCLPAVMDAVFTIRGDAVREY